MFSFSKKKNLVEKIEKTFETSMNFNEVVIILKIIKHDKKFDINTISSNSNGIFIRFQEL